MCYAALQKQCWCKIEALLGRSWTSAGPEFIHRRNQNQDTKRQLRRWQRSRKTQRKAKRSKMQREKRTKTNAQIQKYTEKNTRFERKKLWNRCREKYTGTR